MDEFMRVLDSMDKCEEAPSALLPAYQLQNIVATADFGCMFDLLDVARRATNVEYNPKRFAAAIMRIRAPRTTVLVFRSGKAVCTGAKTVDLAKISVRKVGRKLQKLGYACRFLCFALQNMVASGTFDKKVELRELAKQATATFEPELFPGLIYRIPALSSVALVFRSGKWVITSAKSLQAVEQTYSHLQTVMTTFSVGGP